MFSFARTALVSLAVALVAASTAAAITGGRVDGSAHPYVGAVFVDGSIECSAVLVAPTVVATAGHCAVEGERVGVSLSAALDGSSSGLLSGTAHVDTTKGADLAVVILDSPAGVAPAVLPAAGAVDLLARGALVTSVGYGYSSLSADGSFVYDGLRHAAESPVAGVSKSLLKLSTRDGGPCMGDSGGPQLVGDTVLSITSAGSKDCTGKADSYRLDTAAARAFLGRYLP